LWYERKVERDGDGWLDCSCGNRHWGRFGAAGLLAVDLNSPASVLLQLRAEWSHNGGTWGVPGGARDSHETAQEAALREAHEELGLAPELVEVVGDYADDHGTWRYDTILARADRTTISLTHNHETSDAQWIAFTEVESLPLHPAFGAAWPTLRPMLEAFG
jgi:8-oxo-dGTP diphosphatase